MDPRHPGQPAPIALPVGRSAALKAESEGSLPPTDPTLEAVRPPSPGLGSLYSRQTARALDAFAARDLVRKHRILGCLGASAALLLLCALLLFFLFPRPPSLTAATPTVLLTQPTPALFAATISVSVSADNSLSYVPWGLTDISITATNQFSNTPMLVAAAGKGVTLPPRAVKAFLFSLKIDSTQAGGNGVALLSCAQAILGGSGCQVRVTVTGRPTYIGITLAAKTFSTSVLLK